MAESFADSAALLRRLEPAVRPVGGVGAAQPRQPLERQDFDALLAEAQRQGGEARASSGGGGEGGSGEGDGARADPLGALSQLGAIENPSLRGLIERAGV